MWPKRPLQATPVPTINNFYNRNLNNINKICFCTCVPAAAININSPI